jgi:hypothetical protein
MTTESPVVSFVDAEAWSTWLASFGLSSGVWLKIAKKTSGKRLRQLRPKRWRSPSSGDGPTGRKKSRSAIWLIAGIEHDRVNDRDHSAFGMREDKMPERVDDAPNDLGIR